MAAPNHYQLLGVDSGATAAQIRAAYRAKAKRLHPDVNREPGAAAAFAQLTVAYEVLSDRTRRREYDASLARSDAPAHDPPGQAHYSWRNVATESSSTAAHEPTDFDELYETFFTPHKPAE
jgi:molecular chaperone DnaJ